VKGFAEGVGLGLANGRSVGIDGVCVGRGDLVFSAIYRWAVGGP
jgi:hypothetical protein